MTRISITSSTVLNVHSSTASSGLPVASILFGAVFWGFCWWPLKFFADAGLSGNLIGMTAYAIVGLVAIPIVWRERHQWRSETGLFVLIGIFFGLANITFTTALMEGEVVRVMLLFYLLPAWGALGGVFLLGERLNKRRCVAIALSLIGVFVILGGAEVLNQPFSKVDMMALGAGFCLSATGVVNKMAQKIPMASRSFIPFIFCPPMALIGNYFSPTTMPVIGAVTWLLLVLFAFFWLFGGTFLTTYGVANMEASRASILQVMELFVAIVTAMWLGGEVLELKEYIGGTLIIIATILESLPSA